MSNYPCPFCNSNRTNEFSYGSDGTITDIVQCLDCKGEAPEHIWNSRPSWRSQVRGAVSRSSGDPESILLTFESDVNHYTIEYDLQQFARAVTGWMAPGEMTTLPVRGPKL